MFKTRIVLIDYGMRAAMLVIEDKNLEKKCGEKQKLYLK